MTKKFLLSALTVVSFTVAHSQIKKLDVNNLPKDIKYEGKIIDAVRYTDGLGDNIVLTTETGIYQSKKFKHESDGSDAELFAYHYIIKNGAATPTWKVYDYISDCPVDIEASFVKDTFQVTDLDKDGTKEVWMMYKTVCHGDVSPCDMKVIMYEGTQKYALRGENKVAVGKNDNGEYQYIGGEYKADPAFANGPAAFLAFAKALWAKNIMQKWGEE